MNFILENWNMILAFLGPVAGFFAGFKSRKIDTRKKAIDALQNMQVAYDKFTEQTNKQVDRLMKEIDHLKMQNYSQGETMRLLQQDNGKMHIQVARLMEENNELRKMIEDLKNENKLLKKKK